MKILAALALQSLSAHYSESLNKQWRYTIKPGDNDCGWSPCWVRESWLDRARNWIETF